MSGMTDLQQMLEHLTVKRRDGEFVYLVVPSLEEGARHDPAALIVEDEGITAVVPRSVADHAGLAYDYVATWLTLEIHSALEAVGLTAAFSRALGDEGISCNVIAAYHHDHLLVPSHRSDDAIRALEGLRHSS